MVELQHRNLPKIFFELAEKSRAVRSCGKFECALTILRPPNHMTLGVEQYVCLLGYVTVGYEVGACSHGSTLGSLRLFLTLSVVTVAGKILCD